MKKQLLLLCLALITFKHRSQTGVTNLSFEAWSNNIIGLAPTGWVGTGLSKITTGAQQGNNFVRLKSNSTTQGTMMLGIITSISSPFSGGAPYTQMPVSISGFYKGSDLITNSNTALINSYTKENGQINMLASLTFSTDASVWTSFSTQFFPINGFPNGVDSIFIVINSGNPGSAAILDLDNLSIQSATVVGVDEHSIGTNFLVFPNPAQNELSITSKNESPVHLTLVSLDGKMIKSETLNEGDNKINLENYPGGVYIYQITDKEQNILLRSKLVLQK